VTNETVKNFSPPFRVGLGHDTHRLAAPGPLRIGGMDVPHDKHAVGHSDADVLLHAVTDALLGAVAQGDIGEMFPDTDPANRGRNSAEMLDLAHDCVRKAGFRIGNLDCTIFAERPKISPYKEAIRRRLAEILGIEVSQVEVKAKTGEKVDAVGQELAIQAQCVVLLIADN
jgi:2-C-methyl-D-erythritol 2,4-cyclodiphosphate synthase